MGPGALAELIRAKSDWNESALGEPSTWPQSLKTALSIALSSRFPMVIFWGEHLSLLYNDAYVQILRDKHPSALGARADVAWADIWDVIGPMLHKVLAGEATWSEDRHLPMERRGFVEEAYFTWSYSPILDERGKVGGVFCAVQEMTARVLSERRLAVLRELGEHVAESKTVDAACEAAIGTFRDNANDVPFASIYLVDGDRFRRAATTVVDDATAPPFVDGNGRWGMAEATRSGARRVDRTDVRLPGGPWPEASPGAFVLPISKPGQHTAYGVLVAGLSPRLAFDQAYQGFLGLAAQHIASAISNAVAYEEERKRAEALAEIDRAKTAFFSNVSHEFRTPLTLMLAPIEDMRASSLAPAEREQVDLLHRNALRLLKLVNNLLDFSRIEAGRVDASYEPTDLPSFTAELASTFRSAIERAGLSLVVECEPLAETAFVDRTMWEKIVLNLLSNAFKFTFEGSIAVRSRAADGAFHLEVSDTGIGIAREELPRVFERFHRIDGARSRSHEGSGIGLALVYELVHIHGGDITVASELGEGTTFRISLPLGADHLPRERVRAPRALQSTASSTTAYVEEVARWNAGDAAPAPDVESTKGGRIVVADDNADMREYVTRLLGEHWDVEAVRDGGAALEAVRRNPPDLLIADVMMPQLDGFALLRAIKSDASLKDIPVLLLSARAGEEAVAEGLRAGADDYMVKPFTARELLVRVTARLGATKAAREVIETRTQLYRAFMDAPFPVSVFRGRDYVIEAVNDAILNVWGKDATIVGKPLLEVLPELREQHFAARLDEVYRTGVPYRGVAERARIASGPDGAMRDVYFTYVYSPLFASNGAVDGLMVVAFDVTEQIRDRERLEAAQSAAVVGIFEAQLQTRRVYWSPELYALMGLESGSIAPSFEAFDAIVAEEDRERTQRDFEQTLAAKRTRCEMELRFALPDGTTRWVRFTERIFYDEAGNPARVIGAAVEIEALKRAASARERERRRLLSMLEQVPAKVAFLRGPNLVIEFATPAVLEVLGGRQILGKTVVDALPEMHGTPYVERLQRVYQTGEPYVQHEAPLTLQVDGAERQTYWDSVYVPMRDDAGDIEGVMTFDIEVTQNVLARRELESVSRAKDEFLATMSHELRTPLNAMLGWASMLGSAMDDSARLRQGLAAIERNARAQARLVDDLLDVARIIAGKLRITVEPTDVSSAIFAAADVARPAADAKDVRLVLDLDPELGSLMADPARLQQIVWNLLTNAVRFTPARGRVTVTTERAGNSAIVRVTDTGVGIAREHLGQIFERFRQVDSSMTRSHGGLGLGLAIVRYLVEAHGGKVEAASDGVGHGATFSVTLPMRAVGDVRLVREKPKSSSPPTPVALENVRVLVVDDDHDSLQLLRVILESAGADVTTATRAREALAARGPFDVVVSDIGMPEMDGYSFIRELRAAESNAHTPAIALTAYARKEDARAALRAGYQAHFAKPVDPTAIVAAVKTWSSHDEAS
jgi:PAS domain S-box-containing protein